MPTLINLLRPGMLMLLALASLTTKAHAAVEYGGYRIALGELVQEGRSKLPEAIRASTLQQLRTIDDLKLPANVVTVLQSVDITFDPTLQGQPGVFVVRNGVGQVRVRPLNTTLPIILHELLHGYQFKALGPDHPDIVAGYKHALNDDGKRRFRNTYYLSNEREFFAVTSSIYLVGTIQQPPFNCDGLKSDPTYLAFLRTQFGAGKCDS